MRSYIVIFCCIFFLLLKQFNCKFIALDFLDMKKMPIGKKAKHQSTSAIVKQHTWTVDPQKFQRHADSYLRKAYGLNKNANTRNVLYLLICSQFFYLTLPRQKSFILCLDKNLVFLLFFFVYRKKRWQNQNHMWTWIIIC